ncbi:hypothetical protein PoB_002779600 [Plakobranchus ocellatus]|uniref:Uncharacterized protein n=1 Tax=Plakobranchus ocellatus TaxID=259542 RepID=A0AAV4A3L9_9GAST|nr:hypothetical protein PoB_002779600 [Plakobranchus ocellatus]
MPRGARKRKTGMSQWPPLTFVSSPVFQPAPVLEADAAAVNPVTAKTIPIDDLVETVWVSPQFPQIGQRVLRSSHATYQGSHSVRGLTQLTLSSRKLRFKPLKFLDGTDACDRQPDNLLKKAGAKRLDIACSRSNPNISHDARASAILKVSQTEEILTSSEAEQYTNKENLEQREGLPERLLDEHRSPNFSLRREHQVQERSYPNASHAALCCSSTCKNSNVLRDENIHLKPCLSPSSETKAKLCSISLQAKLSKSMSNFNSSHISERKNCSDSRLARNITVPLSQNVHCVPDALDDHDAMSSSHKNVSSVTPPRVSSSSSLVLALDTPECDYGLSLRGRQLKYGLQDQNSFIKKP